MFFAVDTSYVAAFSFDAGTHPDAMGWTAVDLTQQPALYFHVASDLSGGELTGGTFGTLVPLDGRKSVWCGVAPDGSTPYCGYHTAPGYGSNWVQYFESASLAGLSPPLAVDYFIQWDTEPGYDDVRLQAEVAGQWQDVPGVNGGRGRYDYYGYLEESIPLDASAQRIRFVFRSDEAWSDEDGLYPTDGAVLLDNLTVRDAGGVVTVETFEDEPDDATSTNSGWHSSVPAAFGGFGDLYPGTSVQQDDMWFRNESHLWAWFDVLSGKIPFGPSDFDLYFHNAIESPVIPVSGAGQYMLSFRVYRDLPLDNNVFYYAAVASVVGGCRLPFWSSAPFFYGDDGAWIREELDVSGCVEPDADAVVVRIGVVDLARVLGPGLDHTQAPFVDDVILKRTSTVGPGISVSYADLFQDNFPDDGSTVGKARADAALDIAPVSDPAIQPGDSICITASGVGTDPISGVGPAVYCYVAVRPPGQPKKAGSDIEASDRRPGYGKRFPLLGTESIQGVTWNRFRMDTAFVYEPFPAPNRYCFDLDDAVFEPGDTIWYFFRADDGVGNATYWSRKTHGRAIGQGGGFATSDILFAASSPCEFQVLPGGGWSAGGDILYVDAADGDGANVQLLVDDALDQLGILDRVDRYDILAAGSLDVNNSLDSRVKNRAAQIIGCYKNIIWCSGDRSAVIIGDGTGYEKSDDFGLLLTFLDQHPDGAGLYLSGDNLHGEWVLSTAPDAVALRTLYYNFDLVSDSHAAAGEALSPELILTGACFLDAGSGSPDTLVAYGGYPVANQFDVLMPLGTCQSEALYPGGAGSAILSQVSANGAGSSARVIGSGFSFHNIRDDRPRPVVDRAEHLFDILTWMQATVTQPTGFDAPRVFVNSLGRAKPSPFNPATTIPYAIADAGHVSIRIYNVAGQLVRTLVDDFQAPRSEEFSVIWDGTNDGGHQVSSGVYFVRMVTGTYRATAKVVFVQ